MWKQLFSLAMDGANPLSKVFLGLKLLAVLLVALVLGYAVYQTYDAFASRRADAVVIDAQKKEISQDQGVIADQTKQAENRDAGKAAEDKLIVQQDVKHQQIKKKTADVQATVDHQVDVIQKAPELSPQEKSDRIAQVDIDALWGQYCDAAGSSASGCPTAAPSTTPG